MAISMLSLLIKPIPNLPSIEWQFEIQFSIKFHTLTSVYQIRGNFTNREKIDADKNFLRLNGQIFQ